MDFDALELSRLQFALTISFHVIFASLSIGLAAFLALAEGLWLTTGGRAWKRIYDFWLKLFAICAALAAVSGLTVGYQLGTNWSRFSEVTANVLGPLLGHAVLAAIFLQVTFLALMLSDARRVGRGLHFLATCAVAVGALVSAFWAVSALSWMHTPAGHELRDGVFHAIDWVEVVFNSSFLSRFAHVVLSSWIASLFVVASVGAWLLLRRRARAEALAMMRLALALASVLVPLQLIVGHERGISLHRTQPAAHAAIQGHWQTQAGSAPLILFAWPDSADEHNVSELSVPEIGSLLATGHADGTVYGLSEFPAGDRPNVALVFWSFRLMVGAGLLMLVLAPLGAWAAWRGWAARTRTLQGIFVAALPLGLVAMLAGWVTAEAGRQPFMVYGLVRTAESVSPLATREAAVSFTVYAAVYLLAFAFGAFLMARMAARGPAAPPRPDDRPAPAPAPPPLVRDAEGDGWREAESETPPDTDALSDEELEGLTAPDDEDKSKARPRGSLSAHERLFQPEDAPEEADGQDEDAPESDTDEDGKTEDGKHGNP